MSNLHAISRRRLCSTFAGGSILAALTGPASLSAESTKKDVTYMTGNGEWTYRKSATWGLLPANETLGGTHGAIGTDNAGNVYVSTQSTTGIVVYDAQGKFVKTIAHEFPEVHSMYHAEENGVEYFYTTVQHGTPDNNWLFVKMKLDGTPVLKITAPKEAGFTAPNEWRLTSAVPGPDGSIWIANGYGDSRLFRFDSKGNYKAAFGGKGTADGMFKCNHGLAVDTRYGQPLMMVCDRENRRLVHLDFDGKFVETTTMHLRRPCQMSYYGDYALISELEGRATILDKDNVPVAFLGDNPDKAQWAKYDLNPDDIAHASFSAPHGAFIDASGNVYISDWNKTGRVTRLDRVTL